MVTKPQSSARLAFGPFEVNPAAEELLKGGIRIRLSGQPFQILLLLLANPGEVITREDLRDEIWTEGTFVDFEHGLNAAMNKLRRALGDSANNPRYIETIPGHGYRFIGRVEQRPIVPADFTPIQPPASVSISDKARLYAARWLILPLVVMLAIGTWGLVKLLKSKPAPPAPAIQFAISLPPGAIFVPPISRQSFAISPDGTRLTFTATDSSGTKLWMRNLASLELRPIPGTDDAWSVFWSTDSRSIFYSVKRVLKQFNIDTGSTRSVATLPWMTVNGAWRPKENLLLYLYLGPKLVYEASTRTGSVRKLSGADMHWAQFLPGTDTYIHVVFDVALSHYQALATNYTTGQSTRLLETDSRVEYAPPSSHDGPGYLLYIRAGSLLAQPFDAAHLRLVGEPFPLAQNIIYYKASASGCFSVSNNGVLVYQSGFPPSELRWYDRAGRIISSTRPAPFTGTIRISPDGHHAAADVWSTDSGTRDIWLFNEDGRDSRRLTYPPVHYVRPVWSPDGTRLAFGASRTGPPVLTSLNVEGGGKEIPLENPTALSQIPADQIQIPTDWSRDGRFIPYDTSLGEEEREVWLLDLTNNKITPLLLGRAAQWGAAFSPDGREVAFISAESGRPEVYVQSFEPSPAPHLTGDPKLISRDGAWLVRWRPDGHELFYLGLDAHIYAVPIEHSSFGEPKALFQVPGNPQYGTPTDIQFDVAPGGQRFAITTAASAVPPDFTVIQNWQDKLHH